MRSIASGGETTVVWSTEHRRRSFAPSVSCHDGHCSVAIPDQRACDGLDTWVVESWKRAGIRLEQREKGMASRLPVVPRTGNRANCEARRRG